MPISREEFDRARIDLSFDLLRFLSENSDRAFTQEELAQAMASHRKIGNAELGALLKNLVAEEKVESNTVAGMVYYAYKRYATRQSRD